MDIDGYIKVTDFGLAKKLDEDDFTTSTFVGTPEYFAPEMIYRNGHSHMLDWWTVGIFTYELLFGMPPFSNQNRHFLMESILKNQPTFKGESISEDARDFILSLLQKDPNKRLGAGGV